MTAANHALTGALIGAAMGVPAAAIPLAFLSHFALDTLPHFGYPGHQGFGYALKQRKTYFVLGLDVLCFLLLLYILRTQSPWVYVTAFAAITPDFLWLYRYFFFERFGKKPPEFGFLTSFHEKIQWGERPWGFYVEAVWFVLGMLLLKKIL